MDRRARLFFRLKKLLEPASPQRFGPTRTGRYRLLTTRGLKLLLRGILSGVLLLLVFRKLDWRALLQVLKYVDMRWALVGSALSSLLIIGLALRWRIFLRTQGIQLPLSKTIGLTWTGQFFNSVLPGSTGGDVVKIYQLCRFVPNRKAAAAATVFVDRVVALSALVVLTVIAFIVEPAPLRFVSEHFRIGRALLWLLLLAAGGGLGAWLLFIRLRSAVWVGRLGRILSAAKINFAFNRAFLAGFGLAFTLHLLTVLIAYCCSRALGLSMGFLEVLVLVPTVAFIIMLPISINGHGLREVMIIGYFTQLHVTLAGHPAAGVREIAVAFSLIQVANDLLWSIPGGIWYMMRVKSVFDREPKFANGKSIA